jgi:hypothetical protein
MRSGPGPEATIEYFAVQLGMWLTEMGPLYDWPNESVIQAVENAAPDEFDPKQSPLAAQSCLR